MGIGRCFAHPAVWLAALAGLLGVWRAAAAQGAGLDVSYGRWWPDSTARLYSVGYHRPWLGPIDWGVAVTHVDDHGLGDRTETGGQLSLGLGRAGRGPYVMGTAGLALRHGDGNLGASWSGGLGWAFPLFSFLSVGLEARYRISDEGARGFWHLAPTDRRGLALNVRIATGSRMRAPRPGRRNRPQFAPPPENDLVNLGRERGASGDAARVAADVVGTALDAMGTPYVWGGSDANGYDCSGLIQYAYGEHGIILPRVSRDQLRMGQAVEPRLEALRPGDVLGFSVEGAGVTHVGLYVGDGQFIHSASGGVKLSSLSATDGDSLWWRHHWVGARRLLQ